MRARFSVGFALLALAPAPRDRALADVSLRTFLRGDLIDPLAHARIAEEAGDTMLRAQLGAADDRELTLIAVRASAYAAAPERLIPALAALACGRDPTLAPEAALTLRLIGARLRRSELAAREVLSDDLRAGQRALACAERTPAPRADLAAELAQLADALGR